jgi:hypothetical protein
MDLLRLMLISKASQGGFDVVQSFNRVLLKKQAHLGLDALRRVLGSA